MLLTQVNRSNGRYLTTTLELNPEELVYTILNRMKEGSKWCFISNLDFVMETLRRGVALWIEIDGQDGDLIYLGEERDYFYVKSGSLDLEAFFTSSLFTL